MTEGLLLANPCRGTRLPAPTRFEARFLTNAEVDQLLAVLPPPDRTLALVAVSTGLPWGGLAGHETAPARPVPPPGERRGDVGRGWRPRVVRPAEDAALGADRVSPPAGCRRLAKQLVGHTGELVFTSPEGAPLRRHNFHRRVWEPAARAAGLAPPPRFHDLRHSHVALLIAAGTPMKAISERLGHSSIVITMDRYGHLQPDVDHALIRGLENRLPDVS